MYWGQGEERGMEERGAFYFEEMRRSEGRHRLQASSLTNVTASGLAESRAFGWEPHPGPSNWGLER